MKSSYKKTMKKSSQTKQPGITPPKSKNSVYISAQNQPLEDIPIEQWANGNHCPPPMVLDKKIYVHSVHNPGQEITPMYIKKHQNFSVGIQTDFELPQPVYSQEPLEPVPPQIVMQKTQNSDYYQEDFESYTQSQNLLPTSNSKGKLRKQSYSIKEAEESSDVYDDDFEQMSQSFRRSQSNKSYIQESISYSQNYKR